MKKNKSNALVSLYEWIETFLIALCCVVLLFTFAVKFVTVSGSSMEQTLHNGDRLLITDMFYTPKARDIVVVDVSGNLHLERDHGISKGSPYIKRVIATAGQVIDIDPSTWTVTVDGEKIDEPYVYRCNSAPMYVDPSGSVSYPFTVSDGCVFVMGDNRNGSTDSRFIDEIPEEYILGKVILRIAPEFGGVN